jgi:hypothetical protein
MSTRWIARPGKKLFIEFLLIFENLKGCIKFCQQTGRQMNIVWVYESHRTAGTSKPGVRKFQCSHPIVVKLSNIEKFSITSVTPEPMSALIDSRSSVSDGPISSQI